MDNFKTPLQILQEKQIANDKAIQAAKAVAEAEEAAIAASAKQLKTIVKRLYEDQFLLGNFRPSIIKAYLANQTYIIPEVLRLYDRALRSCIYGLRRVDSGYEFAGSFFKDIKKLQNGVDLYLIGNIIESPITLRSFAVLVSAVLEGREPALNEARAELERTEPAYNELNTADTMLLVAYQGDF